MHVAVLSLLHEKRMLAESEVSGMFEDEVSARHHCSGSEHLIGNGLQTFDSIGRVGKNQIETPAADFKKIEDVVSYDSDSVRTESACL